MTARDGSLGDLLAPAARGLPAFLAKQRWFGGKARGVSAVTLADGVALPAGDRTVWLVLARVAYPDGEPDTYQLVLAFAAGDAAWVRPELRIAAASAGGRDGVVYEASCDRDVAQGLMAAIVADAPLPGAQGVVAGRQTSWLRAQQQDLGTLEATPIGAEQSNTSLRYGDRLVLKLFRRVHAGPNPDLEIGVYLTDTAGFRHTPSVGGFLEYRPHDGRPASTLALLQQFVPNRGDAWQHALGEVDAYLRRVRALPPERRIASLPHGSLIDLAEPPATPLVRELVAGYLESARLLGQRTAELHVALVSHPEQPDFAPEPFDSTYQRALHASMRDQVEAVFEKLERLRRGLPPEAREEAARVCAARDSVLERLQPLLERPLGALRTRDHGDLHLGQVLWTGSDFVFFDFEGEPSRSLAVRRMKRSPLRDVAGMIRSFDYAADHALLALQADGLEPEQRAGLAPWVAYWHLWVSSAYLRAYLHTCGTAPFVPQRREDRSDLLTVFLLEKAVYELGYELDHRPDWVRLPLRGILQLLGEGRGA